MTVLDMMKRPCTIVHRVYDEGIVDEYGDEIPMDEETETVCELQQTTSNEPGDAGELSSEDWIAFFPIAISLNTGDAIRVAGMGSFEVVGDPWYATTGTVQVQHVEVNLRQTGEPGEAKGPTSAS